MLLLAVCCGTWADQIEFDFEDESAHRTSGSNSYGSTPNVYSENDVNISLTYADAVTSGSPLAGSANVMGRIAKNTTNSPVILIGPINNTGNKITTLYYTIKGVAAMKMVAEYSNDNSTWHTLQTTSSMPTTKTVKTVSNLSITDNTIYLRFTVSVTSSTSSNRDFQLDDIILNYEPNSTPSLTPNDLALTGAPIALSFDLYNNASAQTVSYTTSSTGAVTVSESEYITSTVNNGTITVTPVKVTPSAQTITISQEADDTYAAGSATFTVTITDATPYTGGDVTFDATVDTGTSPLTKNEVNFACTNGVLNNGTEYRLYANSTTTFSLSENVISKGYKITRIAFTDESGYSVSNFATPTITPTAANGGVSNWNKDEKTWTGEVTSISFKAGSQVRCTQIVVTVEKPKTLSSIAITTPPTKTTYTEGETFDPAGMVVTATYTDETTAPVTDYTFTPDGALATTDTQVTISYTLNDVTETATQAITVNALPTHIVTFSVNGRTSTAEVKEGNAINFPTVTGTSVLSYVGWTTEAIDGTTNTAPATLVTSATMGTADITYYAVYAKTSVTERTGTYTLDYDNEELSETSGWGTYGTALEYTASDGGVWVIKAYKSGGMQINTSRNASIKVPACSGNIQSIEITGSAAKAVGFSANDYTGSGTITYLAEGTDATEQTLDLTNQNVTTGYIVPKSGNISITNIVVTYDNSLVEVTDYCTTIPVALTVAPSTVDVAGAGGSQELEATFTNFTAEDLNSVYTFMWYASETATSTMDPNPNYNWVKDMSFDMATQKITFTLDPNTTGATRTAYFKLRLVFSSISGEITSDMLTITQAAIPTATITLNAACHDADGMVYGTYSNTSAFVVSDDITVAEVGIVEGKLNVKEYETGAVVPANTGVMVSALEGGDYTVTLTDEQGTSVLGTDNNLRPTGAEGINATDMAAAEDVDCLYYRLTMHNGTTIGFWWGAAEGAAFSVGANKAYLAVPANQAKVGFAFGNDGDATSISTIGNGQLTMENAYNLQGQKVGSAYKGIVIVNGKARINK